uniref:Uncharacterized protein n=1 Tax=Glossina brevipalpis TaxID=37001 RepID=A0A1A9WL30_9MUSC
MKMEIKLIYMTVCLMINFTFFGHSRHITYILQTDLWSFVLIEENFIEVLTNWLLKQVAVAVAVAVAVTVGIAFAFVFVVVVDDFVIIIFFTDDWRLEIKFQNKRDQFLATRTMGEEREQQQIFRGTLLQK